MRFFSGVVVVGAALICGCSSSADGEGAPAESDAGISDARVIDSGGDAGAVGIDAAVVPAFKPEMPQIVTDGGAVLSAPEIVTVTWTTDTNAKAFEAFGDALTTSDYWKPMREYAIGAGVSGPTRHVEVADAPKTTMTEDELDTWVAGQVAAAPGNGWPALTAQSVYVVYAPPTMHVTSGGADDCESTDGFHDETSTSTLAHIVYAVVLESCHDTADTVAFSTAIASHEIVEAASDPHTQTDLAWTGFDADHLAWDIWQQQQDEVADACEYAADADYTENAPFSYNVQRLWSNASAAAGHSPCLLPPPLPYFNTTPLDVEAIAVTTSASESKTPKVTKGFRIGVGQSRTVRFGFYADGENGPWALSFVEGNGFTTPSEPHLTITTDKTAGDNGDIANVSITVNSVGAKTGILMTAISTRGDEPLHYMPVLVGAY